MTATTATSPVNKVAAHWAQKVINRRLRKTGILDTGATSGAAPEEDEDAFEDTGKLSKKTFMFPDKRTNKATKKMPLKHKLCPAAREMNIVPGLHSTLHQKQPHVPYCVGIFMFQLVGTCKGLLMSFSH
jgi:hypothetical protein